MQLLPPSMISPRQLMRRADRICQEINCVLLIVAIGLAVLDFTGFVILKASMEVARTQAGIGPRAPAHAPERTMPPVEVTLPGR
jgi:hypothetical protein